MGPSAKLPRHRALEDNVINQRQTTGIERSNRTIFVYNTQSNYNMGEHSEKHIHFEDGDYGSDGYSDDDARAVEVCMLDCTGALSPALEHNLRKWRD